MQEDRALRLSFGIRSPGRAPPKFANYGAGAYSSGKGTPTAGDGFAFTAPVGSFPPNKLGLYDMSGNAAELCFNGPPLSNFFIKQGGSWASSTQEELRRNYVLPAVAGQRDSTTGSGA